MNILPGMIVRAHCPCGCKLFVGPFDISFEHPNPRFEPGSVEKEIQDQSYAAFYEKCVHARKYSAADIKLERCRVLEAQRKKLTRIGG